MTQSTRIWTAALIVVGDEILSGRTQDRNIAQVATWLGAQGIRLREVRVVPDGMDAIMETPFGRAGRLSRPAFQSTFFLPGGASRRGRLRCRH